MMLHDSSVVKLVLKKLFSLLISNITFIKSFIRFRFVSQFDQDEIISHSSHPLARRDDNRNRLSVHSQMKDSVRFVPYSSSGTSATENSRHRMNRNIHSSSGYSTQTNSLLHQEHCNNNATDEDNSNDSISFSSDDEDDDEGDHGKQRKNIDSNQNSSHNGDMEAVAAEYHERILKKARIEDGSYQRRPTLSTSDLIGPNGVIKLPFEMARIIKPLQHLLSSTTPLSSDLSVQDKRYLNQMATYSQQLIDGYHNFCHDLFPYAAYEDVMARISKLGSKKEIKNYLDQLRTDLVRNRHIESVCGRERCDRILHELSQENNIQLVEDAMLNTSRSTTEADAGTSTAERLRQGEE
jgi:hypothetical protein